MKFAYSDIEEMMKVGSNENINIVAFATIQKEGKSKITSRLYIEKGSAQVYEDQPKDSGSPDTLQEALNWAITDYPSDHLAVVLWDHGSGPLNRKLSGLRGICYDDETGSFLTDYDYKNVLENTVHTLRNGKKIDIVACDACLMANIEIAYAIQSCANFFVASQETIPGDGYDYSRVLEKFKTTVLSPEVFARAMVEAYDKTYQGQKDYTLSLVDLNMLTPLTEATNELAVLLDKILRNDTLDLIRNIITIASSRLNCVHFSEDTYIDLYDFARALLKYSANMPISSQEKKELSTILVKIQRACNNCILENVHSSNLKTARGLSIYFPKLVEGIQKSYPTTYWAKTTQWPIFLNAYVKLG